MKEQVMMMKVSSSVRSCNVLRIEFEALNRGSEGNLREILNHLPEILTISSVADPKIKGTYKIEIFEVEIKRAMDSSKKIALPGLGSSEGSELDDAGMYGLA